MADVGLTLPVEKTSILKRKSNKIGDRKLGDLQENYTLCIQLSTYR